MKQNSKNGGLVVREALLLDIDGVVCEPQQPMTEEVREAIRSTKGEIYYCTGNNYIKAFDLTKGSRIFSNNGHDLRINQNIIWEAEENTLPIGIENYLHEFMKDYKSYGNSIEWRTPSFINFSVIGRFASWYARATHIPTWQDQVKKYIESTWHNVSVFKGSVSVDICLKGHDKSRAGKWLNDNGYTFTFIGDKTFPGGNDYPLVEYCKEHPENTCLTTTGTEQTLWHLRKLERAYA